MKIQNLYLPVFLVLSMFIISACGTGNVVANPNCPQYGCQMVMSDAKTEFKVTDDNGISSLTDCCADVHVKNLEDQPALVSVTADCSTLSKTSTYSSDSYWMQPQSEHDFEIKVDAGWTENWKCQNFQVHSSKVQTCGLYQK